MIITVTKIICIILAILLIVLVILQQEKALIWAQLSEADRLTLCLGLLARQTSLAN